MKLKTNITSRILKERKKRIRNAYENLMDDKIDAAETELKWVSVSNEILEKLTSKASRLRWSLAIGIFCVLVISIGLTIHMPSADVSIELTTKSVTFQLAKDWQKQDVVTDSIFVTNLNQLSAFGLGIFLKDAEPFDLSIKGKNIHLDKLAFSAGSNITFNTQQDNLEIDNDKDSLSGNLNVQEAKIIAQNIDTNIHAAMPEIFSFSTLKPEASPVRIIFTDTADQKYSGFQVKRINFMEETLPGSGIFESLIQGGKITVLQTGNKMQLQQGDNLSLKITKSRHVNITKVKNLLKVEIEGSASKIEAGPGTYSEDLKPTLLEYIYHQQTLAFIWSSALFLWGLLWSIKNSLFK